MIFSCEFIFPKISGDLFDIFILTFWRAEAISLFSTIEKLEYTFKSKSPSLVLTGPKAGGALELRAPQLTPA